MDIPALSIELSQIEVSNMVGVAMLSKSLDTLEDMGEGMTKMMEASVMPYLGQTIDVSV